MMSTSNKETVVQQWAKMAINYRKKCSPTATTVTLYHILRHLTWNPSCENDHDAFSHLWM